MPLIIRLITILSGGFITATSPVFEGTMGIILAVFFIILGLISLVRGGDMLVGGSSNIAQKFGIPPIVVGLTILAFGTSAPELFVNLSASAKGENALLLSNIVGSNISNLLLIGGAAAIITTLPVQKNTLNKEIPISIFAALLLLFFINDSFHTNGTQNILSTGEGLILLAGFVGFLSYVFRMAKNHNSELVTDEISEEDSPMRKSVLFVIVGIYGLYVGGELIVVYASKLAELFGVSKVMIGASIVAIGTSVPELVTSIIAARKNQTDMALGNIIGSNIFNIFWILGLCSVVAPVAVDNQLSMDIIMLIIITTILRITIRISKNKALTRSMGIFLVICYFAYLAFLLWRG